ncbi:type II toxin-antitoxin system VapC family toxin [Candidatus Albibeggiatoa sp. nov. BB20]|uniref:type II toxin-antitoxin system VapC family toxin n=1 Tax=Candidatus Albibeggiatoa sp. nov. BB20 TaxID=3162723 RepID=UPI003365498D
MKYLLDTHIWIWSLLNPTKLSTQVTDILNTEHNELCISVITIWEVVLLAEKQKIAIKQPAKEWITNAFQILPVTVLDINLEIAIKSREIELVHQDPADRFIAATAWHHDIPLLTVDQNLVKASQIQTIS